MRKTIDCLEKFISQITMIKEMEGCAGLTGILYRGQSDKEYQVIPSLCHRIRNLADDDENYLYFEKEIINRVKVEYPQLFASDNLVDELALMQHYGVPTRLMDVTDNPLVALYFACCSNQNKDGEVFVFSTGFISEYTSYDYEEMKSENRLAFVRAKVNSGRQRSQQGLFLWFPDDKLSGISKRKNNAIPLIFNIPASKKEKLLQQLSMVGISRRTLFPDSIDECCKEIVDNITKHAFSA